MFQGAQNHPLLPGELYPQAVQAEEQDRIHQGLQLVAGGIQTVSMEKSTFNLTEYLFICQAFL